jgi:hypothetical protein
MNDAVTDKARRGPESLSGTHGASGDFEGFGHEESGCAGSAPNAVADDRFEAASNTVLKTARRAKGEERDIVKRHLVWRGHVGRGRFCATGEQKGHHGQQRA